MLNTQWSKQALLSNQSTPLACTAGSFNRRCWQTVYVFVWSYLCYYPSWMFVRECLGGDVLTEDIEGHCIRRKTERSAHLCQDPLFSTAKKLAHCYSTHNSGTGATTTRSSKVQRLLLCSIDSLKLLTSGKSQMNMINQTHKLSG